MSVAARKGVGADEALLDGASEGAGELYCLCATVKISPAIDISPLRLPPVLFAVTLNVTVPLPVPLAPLVTVIQLTLLTAVHVHPN
jgi:hypothetical protein